MLSSVTLDDQVGNPVTLHADTSTSKRWLTEAHGLRGVQGLRLDHRVRSQAHGGINQTRYEDGRQITLVGEIASQVSIEDALNEFSQVIAPMVATLDGSPALLKWTEGATGNQLQRLVKLDGDVDPPIAEGASILSYQAQLFAEDPRAYSQTLKTVSSIPLSTSGGGMTFPKTFPFMFANSGGGTVSFTNAGNRPTPARFRIYGSCTNPTIVNQVTGTHLSLIGTIDAGYYIELDVQKRTVVLWVGGVAANRYSMYDGANSTWFDLVANGTTNLQLIASGFDSGCRLDVLARDAWA